MSVSTVHRRGRDGSGSVQGFPAIHWSVVLAAGQDEGLAAHAALETLCQADWVPGVSRALE
jgi:hypothetical protein